jgi:hypothetical protein
MCSRTQPPKVARVLEQFPKDGLQAHGSRTQVIPVLLPQLSSLSCIFLSLIANNGWYVGSLYPGTHPHNRFQQPSDVEHVQSRDRDVINEVR